MRRVLVLGCSGSGKSTLARALAHRLGLPAIHLDAEYWRPGWRPTPRDEFDRRVADLVARDAWVMDGNFAGTLEPRLARADTVVHLDFAAWRCLCGVLKRTFLACNFDYPRPDMGPGCPERWDWEFIEWIINFRQTERPKTLAAVARHAGRIRVITLTTRRQVTAFVDALPASADRAAGPAAAWPSPGMPASVSTFVR